MKRSNDFTKWVLGLVAVLLIAAVFVGSGALSFGDHADAVMDMTGAPGISGAVPLLW